MALESNNITNATKNRIYREQLITMEDLNEFRSLLLNDLKGIIQSRPLQQEQ